MFATMRMACWVSAIFFAIAPVTLGVVTAPQHIGRLFSAASYVPFARDLIFVAIAVLAIGLIDSLETILLVRNRRGWLNKSLFAVTFIWMLLIYFQLFLYAAWATHMENASHSPDSTTNLLYMVLLAAISALFARVTLISSPTG
jgi:hypothetical protein